VSLMLGDHPPSRMCDCPECRAYFDFRSHQAFLNHQLRASMDRMPVSRTPMLDRMRSENRPHLRDPAFLKFMANVVGNTLKPR
jgi:hypothetical protein